MVFVLVIASIAGCTTSSSSPPPSPSQSPSSIKTVIAGTNDEWSLSMGCYAIVTGYAYNTGSVTVDSVVVYLTLVYPDGTIRDSSVVYMGSIPSQGSENFHVILDRECGEEYSLRIIGTP